MYADCTVYAFLHAVMVDTCSGEAPLSKINNITEISEGDPEILGQVICLIAKSSLLMHCAF